MQQSPPRFHSPLLSKGKHTNGEQPFRISLLEMPLDPSSPPHMQKNKLYSDHHHSSSSMMDAEQRHSLIHSGNDDRQVKGPMKSRPPLVKTLGNPNSSFRLSQQNSHASLNINGPQKENIQEVLSMASEKKFGLGGRIVSSLNTHQRKFVNNKAGSAHKEVYV